MTARLRFRGLRPPGALVALLAAGALAGAPAPAAADPNGAHAGGGREGAGHSPPGQGAPQSASAAPAAPAPASSPPAPAEARRDRESKEQAPEAPAPQVAATGVVDPAPAGLAPAGAAPGRSARGREPASGRTSARRPSPAPPAATTSGSSPAPRVDPAPSAPASAEPTVAEPAGDAAPASGPAPARAAQLAPSVAAAVTRKAAVRRAAQRRARARLRAGARASVAAARRAARTSAGAISGSPVRPAPARPAAGGLLSAGLATPALGARAATGGPELWQDPGTAAPRPEESAIARTVVEVLEVIPLRLRIALAALTAIGFVLGVAALVQARRLRGLERQRGRLAADVGVLQSALLPVLPERIGGARVTAAYRPAEGLAGGGDFFDGFELPGGRTAVLVGDVAGHGRDVVPVTALVRYSLRAYLEAGLEPRAALAVASDVLGAQLDGRLVTVVVAIFDPAAGRLTYACAGHWPPALLGVPFVPLTVCASPPLGAGVPTGRRQTTVALPPGAAACLYTDGLADVVRGPDRLGLDAVARELHAVGPGADAADLLDRIVRLSDRQPDDMAVCLLTALPGGGDGGLERLELLEGGPPALRGARVERYLRECGVDPGDVAPALAAARAIAARAGTAVLEVRCDPSGARALAVAPDPPALPVGRAGARALAATA